MSFHVRVTYVTKNKCQQKTWQQKNATPPFHYILLNRHQMARRKTIRSKKISHDKKSIKQEAPIRKFPCPGTHFVFRLSAPFSPRLTKHHPICWPSGVRRSRYHFATANKVNNTDEMSKELNPRGPEGSPASPGGFKFAFCRRYVRAIRLPELNWER